MTFCQGKGSGQETLKQHTPQRILGLPHHNQMTKFQKMKNNTGDRWQAENLHLPNFPNFHFALQTVLWQPVKGT